MPAVNWDVFQNLPGSPEANFEQLCRALIRHHYARYGEFKALAAQPGVEFHLRLHSGCSLGAAGGWWGWQCRWYDLRGGTPIGTGRRQKIEKAIATTENVLPELTDWVLWTRHPLTAGDQEWFCKLNTHMRLHQWHAQEVEDHLSGEALILRATYFGELILTPQTLLSLHEKSVAVFRARWLPEVHQSVHAERELRRMLGETGAWDTLSKHAAMIEADAVGIEACSATLTAAIRDEALGVASVARIAAKVLIDVHTALLLGDLELLREQLATVPVNVGANHVRLLRKVRAAGQPAALFVTNALADIRCIPSLLEQVKTSLGERLMAVLAEAGCGKTQLSAQLSAPTDERPAGILLYGRNLQAGKSLDDLANRVVIPGSATPVPSMEALLAAVDAAGQRSKRRLPLVIDGLNESEDPRDWMALLASLAEILKQYSYVLVICTIRPGFAADALPESCRRVEIPGFEGDTAKATVKYFRHYKINSGDADLPWRLLQHPLTLRLFCEATNPTRLHEVGLEKMPGSLTAVFDLYLDAAAKRIAELAPRTRRHCQLDVRAALDEIGWALWETGQRELDLKTLQQIINDSPIWNESLVQALEQDGVLLREPGDPPHGSLVSASQDTLAGHLVARAVLSRLGRLGLSQWLKDTATLDALIGPYEKRHSLAGDIFQALCGLTPRALQGPQLWTLLDGPLKMAALRNAADLEAEYLDSETVRELTSLVYVPAPKGRDILWRLFQTRAAREHPLNMDFLDAALRTMKVAARDLRWSEWIREHRNEALRDLSRLEKRWSDPKTRRTASDPLRARWVMWLLTSTDRELRDMANRALYWFGRGDPVTLFEESLRALTIDDPYVPERMLAASYGVAMARHVDLEKSDFVTTVLSDYARRVYDSIFAEGARFGTTHCLTREYARRILELAVLHCPTLFSEAEIRRSKPPFEGGGQREWEKSNLDKELHHGPESPFRMHFLNYTLGRLVPGRANYDFRNEDYLTIRAQVLWRVEQLGWSYAVFGDIDSSIERESYRSRAHDNSLKTERYGKKYSLIAFFEMSGLLRDQGKIDSTEADGRPWDVDIDPSFPNPSSEFRLIDADFLGEAAVETSEWIASGPVPDVHPYLRCAELRDEAGPWVALDGFLTQEDERRGRRTFFFIRSFLVSNDDADAFVKRLSAQDLGGRWLPETPSVVYTFAGEIPWCATFPENGLTDFEFVVGEGTLKVEGKAPGAEAVTGRLAQFKALMPVCEFGWEGYHSVTNSAGHAMTLAKEIARDLGLVSQPQTFDLFTGQGRKATFGIASQRADFSNKQSLLFMREEFLKSYLEKHRLTLVWAVWGEREYSSKKIAVYLDGFPNLGQGYAVFKLVKRLAD